MKKVTFLILSAFLLSSCNAPLTVNNRECLSCGEIINELSSLQNSAYPSDFEAAYLLKKRKKHLRYLYKTKCKSKTFVSSNYTVNQNAKPVMVVNNHHIPSPSKSGFSSPITPPNPPRAATSSEMLSKQHTYPAPNPPRAATSSEMLSGA